MPSTCIRRRAHSLASWLEARYWEEWARREGLPISAAAFLRGHPLRTNEEITDVIEWLGDAWDIDVPETGIAELRQAQTFALSKGLRREVRR